VSLCLAEAEGLNAPMFIGPAVKAIWQLAKKELGPDSDYTEIIRCIEQRAGVEVGPSE
jgi:hypothetical protein